MWTLQNPILQKKKLYVSLFRFLALLLAFTFDMRNVYGNNWNLISDLNKKSLKELRRHENDQQIKKNFKII